MYVYFIDPAESWQGFMSVSRIRNLLSKPKLFDKKHSRQLIFPNIRFSCNGAVISCIVAGVPSNGNNHPELQVWSPTGNGVYTKSSNETLLSAMTVLQMIFIIIP